jgi:hypothetical protein
MARRHVACHVPEQRELRADHCSCRKGQTGTFDTSRPITIIPTWISGPEPDEEKNMEITMKYRTAQGKTGTILLTYWTPMSGPESSLSPDKRAAVAQVDQQLHDTNCWGIP